ncbi:hypothetical protein [Dyadobacter sediminis]|uniref:Outer membrane protein beta-barrel domain-containing protein n=1 Tax=Dyadobacter sediminis TaxID=1493691 RepID=A0A5R9K862_9BACT|nr:hypothetical protein [Dyadobacter sediminis]TLU90009.1 hypothetical protein FEM55_21050 [Dyadobacter sediminis]GGC10949.1 hypothetical protein GCM10011325_42170 [Dyadobacter sediminis]
MLFNFTRVTFLLTAIFSSVFFAFTISNANGQGKLLEGYIVTTQNDTIFGSVRDEGWTSSPTKILFKKKDDSIEEPYSAKQIAAFCIPLNKANYRSKKIGIRDITLAQIYKTAPSMVAKDSVHIFLQKIVAGEKASLYEYVDLTEESRFFVEKDNQLTELYNYPFYKEVNNKKYLLVYDDYKRQLQSITYDSETFKVPVPDYQKKSIKKYIEQYNQSLTGEIKVNVSADDKVVYDLDINLGSENWNSSLLNMKNKFTYGFGLRITLPRRFQNRYFRLNYFMTPGLVIRYDNTHAEKFTLNTFEAGLGSYIGSGIIRPYLGFNYSGVFRNYRPMFLGVHGGISYKRRLNLEVGHLANFYSVFGETEFFNKPRITLHYLLSIDDLFKK